MTIGISKQIPSTLVDYGDAQREGANEKAKRKPDPVGKDVVERVDKRDASRRKVTCFCTGGGILKRENRSLSIATTIKQ